MIGFVHFIGKIQKYKKEINFKFGDFGVIIFLNNHLNDF